MTCSVYVFSEGGMVLCAHNAVLHVYGTGAWQKPICLCHLLEAVDAGFLAPGYATLFGYAAGCTRRISKFERIATCERMEASLAS